MVAVYLELGSKRVFACACDWPGWCRSGRDEQSALQALAASAPRYAAVAARAGAGFPDGAGDALEVVDRVPGSAGTDFGVPGAVPARDLQPVSADEARRAAAILGAAWTTLKEVAAHAPAELRKGPRGGGRDRDQIIRHVNGAEIYEFAPKVGVKVPLETRDDAETLRAYRDAFVEGIREHHARGESARSWALQFLIRRCAWHMLDHAWELEDRDLMKARTAGLGGGPPT